MIAVKRTYYEDGKEQQEIKVFWGLNTIGIQRYLDKHSKGSEITIKKL